MKLIIIQEFLVAARILPNILLSKFKKWDTCSKFFCTNYSKNDDLFVIQTDEGFYNAKSVIVCTGIREKEFKIPGEDSFEKRGISRCAICDGALYRRRDIAVYGHKNTAVIEANYLLDISPKVYFIADSKLDADESETALMKSILI